MARNEEDLEFISVSPDGDDGDNGNMSQSYGAPNTSGGTGYDNVVGNWILNQSKVFDQYKMFCCPERDLILFFLFDFFLKSYFLNNQSIYMPSTT